MSSCRPLPVLELLPLELELELLPQDLDRKFFSPGNITWALSAN